MDYIVWLLLLSGFFVCGGAIIVLTIGIVWSPVGALLCGIAARKRGMSTARYALAGAFYSALFILPWIYLMLRLLDRKAPTDLVRLGYVVIYIFWLFGPIALWFTLFYVFSSPQASSNNPFLDDYEEHVTQITILIGSAISLLANVIFWMRSLYNIRQARINDKSHSRSYVMPFIYPAVLMILSFLIFPILDWGLRYIVR